MKEYLDEINENLSSTNLAVYRITREISNLNSNPKDKTAQGKIIMLSRDLTAAMVKIKNGIKEIRKTIKNTD